MVLNSRNIYLADVRLISMISEHEWEENKYFIDKQIMDGFNNIRETCNTLQQHTLE